VEDERNTDGRVDDRITLAALFLALWLPLIATGLASPERESASERRRLAPPPELALRVGALRALPGATTAYVDDHPAFRDRLILWRSFLWIRVLGTSPSPRLIVGSEGWLFRGFPRERDPYNATGRVPERELGRWRRSFEERQRWLAARGISYLLVLAPLKSAIYREHLPAWLAPPEDSAFAQLARELATRSNVAVLDLGPVLRAASGERRVYHKTDTHWNDEGAYVAYAAILEATDRQLGTAGRTRLVEVERETRRERGLVLAELFGLSDLIGEEVLAVRPKQPRALANARQQAAIASPRRAHQEVTLGVGDPDLPRAVVFRDSFATALVPFLSEHFRRIVFQWNMDVDPVLVKRRRPDIVIHEIWEGSLYGERWGPRQSPLWTNPARPWLEGPLDDRRSERARDAAQTTRFARSAAHSSAP
jgi:hypothetical protein